MPSDKIIPSRMLDLNNLLIFSRLVAFLPRQRYITIEKRLHNQKKNPTNHNVTPPGPRAFGVNKNRLPITIVPVIAKSADRITMLKMLFLKAFTTA